MYRLASLASFSPSARIASAYLYVTTPAIAFSEFSENFSMWELAEEAEIKMLVSGKFSCLPVFSKTC